MLFSEIKNKKVITEEGKFLGYVKDLIFNFKLCKVSFISLVDVHEIVKAKDITKIRDKLIPFDKVVDIKEVVIVREK